MTRWILVAAVVLTSCAGDALQTMGMKRHGEIRSFRPGALGRAFARVVQGWHVPVSVLLLAASFLAFVTLLSIADLSFAVPATAAEYVVGTMAARYLLKERVDWRRWAGAGLVAAGVALLAL